VTALQTRDERLAALAAALAHAAVAGEVAVTDAIRGIKHELRRRNTNRARRAPCRSRAAQDVIDRDAAEGRQPPNGSLLRREVQVQRSAGMGRIKQQP
jgi:hypothetical protein